ncbi:aspartate aminotransferase family protein [Calditrichota bacterium]
MDTIQQLEQQYHFQLYKRFSITIVSGKGSRITDSNGNEYIDALAGIAVNSVGHCHPNVVEAIKTQAEKLIHTSNLYYTEPQAKLAKLLTEISGLDRVFFTNSGVEAAEGAIKLARRYAFKKGRSGRVLSFEGCFHGRTLATVAMGKKKYQEGFGPLPEGFAKTPFNDITKFRKNIDEDIIAVILEPVQGEGGIKQVNSDFLKEICDICRKKDILIIFDEIQCGMGRTGKMFAFQHCGVMPDILTSAKALGGGFPIGAVMAREEVASAFDPGIHGTTFGGNPLGCAAAFAAVNTILSENLPERAKENGDYFIEKLRKAAAGSKAIKEIRGIGLMIGIELNFNGGEVVNKMLDKGVLANCTSDVVIRLLPPLIISKSELDIVFEVLMDSISEVESNG